jgi:hypothetical protein
MKRTKKYIQRSDFECRGSGRTRKARRLPKGVPNVCYVIRPGVKDAWGKRHVAELFSGKTGDSLGFIGPACSIVPTPAQAESSDHLNRMTTESLLRDCVGKGQTVPIKWRGKDDGSLRAKSFKKAIKEAQKKRGPKK